MARMEVDQALEAVDLELVVVGLVREVAAQGSVEAGLALVVALLAVLLGADHQEVLLVRRVVRIL